MQAKDLRDGRQVTICERCDKRTITTGAPQDILSSHTKTTSLLFSRPFSLFQFRKKRVPSHAARGVELGPQMTIDHPTQCMPPLQWSSLILRSRGSSFSNSYSSPLIATTYVNCP